MSFSEIAFGPYISQNGKEMLQPGKYTYNGVDSSYISPYFQPFWRWCASLLSKEMAYYFF
jgi:hypothetical protein